MSMNASGNGSTNPLSGVAGTQPGAATYPNFKERQGQLRYNIITFIISHMRIDVMVT